MNVLLVNPNIPYPLSHGGNLRMYNIFKRLKGKHRIYLLCFINDESEKRHLKNIENIFDNVETVLLNYKKNTFIQKVTKLTRIFRWDYIYSKNNISSESVFIFRDKIFKMIYDYSIDIMHVHLIDLAHLCYDIDKVPKLLDTPDCLSLTKERYLFLTNNKRKTLYFLYKKLLLLKTKQYEKIITKYFEVCTTVSEIDENYYKKLNPEINSKVIPNGVDLKYFKKSGSIDEIYPSVVFWGNMDFSPNVDAVKYFYNEIFPEIRKHFINITFYIVGSSPVEEILEIGKDEQVTVTGFVDDIRPWIEKGTICITPMRIGSGIKNKILEAMAMSKPVVSTKLGSGGINVKDGDNILLANNAYEFAKTVVKLLKNKKLRNKISINGRLLVEQQHNWSALSNKYYHEYAKACQINHPLT
jgi:sugar transferase (PEP-CTERM/EpsH1 system associated)